MFTVNRYLFVLAGVCPPYRLSGCEGVQQILTDDCPALMYGRLVGCYLRTQYIWHVHICMYLVFNLILDCTSGGSPSTTSFGCNFQLVKTCMYHVQERGESFYNPKLPGIVEALAEAGVLEDSEGAKVVWTEPENEGTPPLMVQKTDGGFGYARYTPALPVISQFFHK